MSIETSRFYCQKCSKATLYAGARPIFCSMCGANYLTGLPALLKDNKHDSQVKASIIDSDNDFAELVDDGGGSDDTGDLGGVIENSRPEPPEPEPVKETPKTKKRGRPKKNTPKPNDKSMPSWFAQECSSKPNSRRGK